MQRLLIAFLFGLLILNSCKLKDNVTAVAGTGDTTIKVVAPNGGEILSEGSNYQIQWTGTGALKVRIQYSIDNGTTWTLIVDSLTNVATYNWSPVPNTISSQCLIRVSSVDGISSDQSDKVFSIVKNSNMSLKITSPIGGEIWEAGSSKQITWYSSGIDSVKIYYTIDNGQNWNYIATDKKNTGIYFWYPIPSTPSSLAKVRIVEAKDGTVSTESPATFTITPQRSIKIVAPNGASQWYAGSSDNIIWTSVNITNVKIEYTINGGGSWTTLVASTPSTGVYSWNPIPNVSSLQCKLKISNVADNGTPSVVSDSNFTITYPGSQLVNVVSPNGGEKWAVGSTQTIKWNASGITNVKIEYTINNGINWSVIIASTPSTGFYTWNQIPNLPSTNCKIRISDAVTGAPSDASDNFFSIIPAPLVVVTSPNGGETWLSGNNKSIAYTSQYVPNVKIEFTTNGGANWTTIDNSTPAIGTYSWTVPNLNSSQCKIKISDALFGDPTDMSDNNFIITNVVIKSIKVTSPVGGENWEAGTNHNITWSSTAINKVKVELTTDKGSTWKVLADSVAGGAYEWSIDQNLNSTQCQIRVSDAGDIKVSDISAATFIISPRKWITVTGPATRIYKSNEPITITWQSGGIQYVGIKYTATNGVADLYNPAFTVLADKVGATSGSYTTYFSRPSDQYFVVVYDADDGANGTPSNNSPGFTIEQAYTSVITVIQPNGGEQWLGNNPNVSVADLQNYHPFEIKWNATNLKKVKIEWSTNGGGNWYVVPGADSTANDGSFVWAPGRSDNPIRPDSSDNCKIRISSADKDIIATAITAGFFSIHMSPKIQLTFPNNGEDFYKADTTTKPNIHWPMLIGWTSYAVASVDIFYSLDNGVTWNTLATNYQSTGAFGWDFITGPLADYRISELGRIKIVDHSDGRIWDINDIPFWLNIIKSSGKVIPITGSKTRK